MGRNETYDSFVEIVSLCILVLLHLHLWNLIGWSLCCWSTVSSSLLMVVKVVKRKVIIFSNGIRLNQLVVENDLLLIPSRMVGITKIVPSTHYES